MRNIKKEHNINGVLGNDSFKLIFDEYYIELCAFANNYISDEDQCEDLVIEVFEDFWDKRSELDIKVSIKSLLFVTVKNRCLNFIKSQNIKDSKLKELTYLESDSVYEYNFIEEEVHYRLYKALEKLPEKSKEVIMLSLDKLSNEEIKDKLNVSINTVKSNKKRAYKLLKSILGSS